MTFPAPQYSLKRTYFFSAVSGAVGILYPIITLAYVARVLGPESLGKYYFANSLASYFLFAACLGIPVYGTREIGRVRGDPRELKKIFSQLFFINLLSSIAFGLIYGAVVLSVPDFRHEVALFGILGLLFLSNIFSFDYLYAGLERQDNIVYRSVISKLVSVALIFALVRDADDYLWFAGIAVIMSFLNGILALQGLKYWAGFKEALKGSLRRHLRSIVLIAVSMFFINVYVNLDSVILGLMAGPHEVGLYNAAVRPCRLVAVLLSAMTGAALPRLSYYFAGGADIHAQRTLKKKSLEMLLMFAMPISLTFAASAGPVIQLMYGPGFSEAASSLALAAPLLILNSVATFHAYQILLPLGKESYLIPVALAGAVFSVALNLVLIPVLGYHGAVITALAAEVASILVQVVMIGRLGKNLLVFPTAVWKYLAAGGFLVLIQIFGMSAAGDSLMGLGALWALSAVVYGLLLWILREPLLRQMTERLLPLRKP